MESPTLTPSGGEFLSQLERLGILFKQKQKNLTKRKNKERQRKNWYLPKNCEHLRAKEQQAVSKLLSLKAQHWFYLQKI